MRLLRPAVLIWGLLAAACGGGDAVQVFAASSLTDVLPSLVERYREQHREVEFDLSFAGSQTLATQIEEGAPADLYISADAVQAGRLRDAGLVQRATVLVENRLVLAVRDDAPWSSVEEVAAAGGRIAMGASSVPVGALTASALRLLDPGVAARLRAGVVTRDPNVRLVLSRVETGEADAAFVYSTDLAAARGVRAIELPAEVPRNEYIVALVIDRDGDTDERAEEFFAFLFGGEAQALLEGAGFIPVQARPLP